MLKWILALFLGLLSPLASASSTQMQYWISLVSGITNLTLGALFVGGLFGFLYLGIVYAMQLLGDKKDSMGRRDMKPMNLPKFIGGLAVCSILVAPFGMMRLAGDLTGLSSGGRPLCFVSGVSVKSSAWISDANQCMDQAIKRVKELSGFAEVDGIAVDTLRLLFAIVQMIAMIFIGHNLMGMLIQIFGFRNVKSSMSRHVIGFIISTVIFMFPNLADYASDVMGINAPSIIATPK